MSRHFSAILLLDQHWKLNVDAIATALRTLYPGIGEIDPVPGQAEDEDAGVLIVDGATVVLQSHPAPVPQEQLNAPLRTLRAGGAEEAVARHTAHITISAGGALPGLEGAEAYAAVVHFVAAAALSVTPSSAVLWKQGWALTRAETFATAANMLLQGKMPVGTWVSFATVVPTGLRPEQALGMVTYGMRPFIGRELELAPRPADAKSAFRVLNATCRVLLDRGLQISDGMVLDTTESGVRLTVREKTYWLRRDQSAYVLVTDDAIVDPASLRARKLSA